jgi:hypothetical protein
LLDDHAIAPGALGFIERVVRSRDELSRPLGVDGGIAGHSKTDGNRDIPPLVLDPHRGNELAQAFGDDGRTGYVDAATDDRKLLPSEPCKDVLLAQGIEPDLASLISTASPAGCPSVSLIFLK